MDAINRSATGMIGLFERYGMALVMLFVLDIFMPNLAPKVELVELNLSEVTDANSGSNVLKQLFWLGMFAGYLMLHLVDRMRILRQTFLFWVMLLWLTVLVATASSNYFGTSLKRAIFQFIFLFVVFSATYYAYRNRTLRMCVWFSGLVVIGLSLFTLIAGVGSNSLGLAGYTNGKNVLGAYIAILFLMTVVAEFVEGRKVPFSLLFKLALLGLLLLTKSKTSFVVLLLILFMARTNLLLVLLTNLAILTGAFILFVFWPAISYELGDYWHISQVVPSTFMTNRGEIWDACYQDLEEFGKLLTGWGYASYFAVKEIPYGFDIKWSFLQYINSSHNGYISVLIQFGLFMAVPIYFAIIGLVYRVRNLVLQAALMFPIIHNLAESSFLRDQHAVWFSFVWISGVGLIIANRTRQISIIQGIHEYQLEQQVQWQNQKVALEKAKARIAPYLPLEEPNIKPGNQPLSPSHLPETQPAFVPVPPPSPPLQTPVNPKKDPETLPGVLPGQAPRSPANGTPDNPYGPNVIVAHWAKPQGEPTTNTLSPTDYSKVLAFKDALAKKKAQTGPSGVVKTVWAGVELTLITDNIITPLEDEALKEMAARTLLKTANENSHTFNDHQLDQVANGLVSGHWQGHAILFATDGITQPIDGSALSAFHDD